MTIDLGREGFQSTHSWECDWRRWNGSRLTWSFNPRTHESATVLESVDGFLLAVSIHALMRVRPQFNNTVRVETGFQSTHSWECDEAFLRMITVNWLFQSTHSWECDLPIFRTTLTKKEFQSTHSWECDRHAFPPWWPTAGFNPRTHESATQCPGRDGSQQEVSIHALMRVRPVFLLSFPAGPGFNPRTHESATCL